MKHPGGEKATQKSMEGRLCGSSAFRKGKSTCRVSTAVRTEYCPFCVGLSGIIHLPPGSWPVTPWNSAIQGHGAGLCCWQSGHSVAAATPPMVGCRFVSLPVCNLPPSPGSSLMRRLAIMEVTAERNCLVPRMGYPVHSLLNFSTTEVTFWGIFTWAQIASWILACE